jgi:hypothetical protein
MDETTSPSSPKPFLLALAVLITVVVLASLFFLFINSKAPAKSNPISAGSTSAPAVETAVLTPTPTPTAPTPSALDNLGFEDGLTGWVAGDVTRDKTYPNTGYSVDVDHSIVYSGTASAYIQSTNLDPKQLPKTYGYISTRISADMFRGKRVRFSAYLRTQK